MIVCHQSRCGICGHAPTGVKLADCDIDQIEAWVAAGRRNKFYSSAFRGGVLIPVVEVIILPFAG